MDHMLLTVAASSGVASPEFEGAKLFDFIRATVFCLEYHFLSTNLDILKILGAIRPLATPMAASFVSNVRRSHNTLRLISTVMVPSAKFRNTPDVH